MRKKIVLQLAWKWAWNCLVQYALRQTTLFGSNGWFLDVSQERGRITSCSRNQWVMALMAGPIVAISLSHLRNTIRSFAAEFQRLTMWTNDWHFYNRYWSVRIVIDFRIVMDCRSFQVYKSTASAQSVMSIVSCSLALYLMCTNLLHSQSIRLSLSNVIGTCQNDYFYYPSRAGHQCDSHVK